MSDYYCDCGPYSYPYRQCVRVAKKQHKCGECGCKINPGDSYEYVTGKCEGDWFDAKTCSRCLDLREFVKAHVPCLCIMHGNANEDIIGAAEHYDHEAPGLLFGALRRVVKINRHGRAA